MKARNWQEGATAALGAAGAVALLRASRELVEQRREHQWARELSVRLRGEGQWSIAAPRVPLAWPPAPAPSPPLPVPLAAAPEPVRLVPPAPAVPRRPAPEPIASQAAARTAALVRARLAPLAQVGASAPSWSETWSFELPSASLPQRRREPARARRSPWRYALLAPICALAVLFAVPALGSGHRAAPAAIAPRGAAARTGIPLRDVEFYERAGREYGLPWTMLAAVGQVESAQRTRSVPGSTHDPADATTAMAAYLKASGAPQNWRAALYADNHSSSYVAAVLARGRTYAHELGN